MKWDYLSSPPQTAMQLHRGGLEKTDNLPKKKPWGGSMYSTLGPGYFKESQSLISQAEMAKISGSYISRQDRAPVWYCYFLPGFSRAVNSSCPRQSTPPNPTTIHTPSLHLLPSPLSAPHFLLEISVTLIHRVCRWLTRKSCVNYHQPLPAGRAAGNQRGLRVFHTREEQ